MRRVLAMACVSATAFFVSPLSLFAHPFEKTPVTQRKLPENVELDAEWVTGLSHPWGMDFLPDGRYVVTERTGKLKVIEEEGEEVTDVSGLPPIYVSGQGGLLDVLVHPDWSMNHLIFLTFSEGNARENHTAVYRAKLVKQASGWTLEDGKVIYRQTPSFSGSHHFGSRLAMDDEGGLYVSLGERSSQAEYAQNTTSSLGKIVKLTVEGQPFSNNPFRGKVDILPEIWSLGHRNPQGLEWNAKLKQLWSVEHGPRGGDELNLIESGDNYGWPLYTYGRKYTGGKIGEPDSPPGFAAPSYVWVPSVSPAGLAWYQHEAIAAWTDRLLIATLNGKSLITLSFTDKKVVEEQRYLSEMGLRFRQVKVGKQGDVFLLVDDPKGKIMRLSVKLPPLAPTP